MVTFVIPAYDEARLLPATLASLHAAGGFDESLFASEEIAFSRALKRAHPDRAGRFVVLRETVVTSGRKLRDPNAPTALWTLLTLSACGAGRSRQAGLVGLSTGAVARPVDRCYHRSCE